MNQILNTQKNPPLMIISSEMWDDLQFQLNEIASLIRNRNSREVSSDWIESEVARKILGVSKRTWLSYRQKRILPFCQLGKKIFIKRGDLDHFMQINYIPAAV